MVFTVTKDNFEEEVLKSKIPVLVDFWAPWCGPCLFIGPIVDELATELDGKIKVGKINIDEQQELSMQFGVMSIPTLAVFKDGQLSKKAVGAMGKEDLKKTLAL